MPFYNTTWITYIGQQLYHNYYIDAIKTLTTFQETNNINKQIGRYFYGSISNYRACFCHMQHTCDQILDNLGILKFEMILDNKRHFMHIR